MVFYGMCALVLLVVLWVAYRKFFPAKAKAAENDMKAAVAKVDAPVVADVAKVEAVVAPVVAAVDPAPAPAPAPTNTSNS